MLSFIYILLLAMAIFQIVSLLLRLITKRERKSAHRTRLRIYGFLVLIYLVLLLAAFILEWFKLVSWNNLFIVIYIFVIPSCLAFYYWHLMYRRYDSSS